MSGHRLIEGYLDRLRVLPGEVVDELTDGLLETYDDHRARGRAPDDAARAAITEFGTTKEIIAAYERITPGRRVARALLATGPLAGLCWGAALLSARVWTWPAPAWASPVIALALLTVIALLLTAARGRHTRRAASVGAAGLVGLDTLAIACVAAAAPAMAWPLQAAMLISLARACLTARALPGILTR